MINLMTNLFGQEHIDRYLATDGQEGYYWNNETTILVLFTTGRRTGTQRPNALIYREFGKDFLVVASKGGSDDPPAWYLNLVADPRVEVQIKGDRFAARARIAPDEEKPAMWQHMLEVWPAYADYQSKTTREIPVVVLERA